MQQSRRKVAIYSVAIWLLWGTFVLAYDLSILRPYHASRSPDSSGSSSEMLKPDENQSEQLLEQNTAPVINQEAPSRPSEKLGLYHLQFQSDYIHQYGPTQSQAGVGYTLLGGNHVTKK